MKNLVTTCLLVCMLGQNYGSPMPPRPQQVQEELLPIEMDDMIKGRFSPKGFNGSWVSGKIQ